MIPLSVYVSVEQALIKRLLETWRPTASAAFATIHAAIARSDFGRARAAAAELDLVPVVEANREWVKYMLYAAAKFGSKMASPSPTSLTPKAFENMLNRAYNTVLLYATHQGNGLIRDRALQSIAAYETTVKKWATEKHTLYVRRDVLNGEAIVAWAKSVGFDTTLDPHDLHVTVVYSRTAVDWDAVPEGIDPMRHDKLSFHGGLREMGLLGPKQDVAVLKFTSHLLQVNWRQWREAGASWDYPHYQPHVTISAKVPAGLDVLGIKPYSGTIELGPEVFQAIDEKWREGVAEKVEWDESKHPRVATGSPEGGEFTGALTTGDVVGRRSVKPSLDRAVRGWYEGGGTWLQVQQAARNLITGPHGEPTNAAAQNRAEVLLKAINDSPTLNYPLFRGLSDADQFKNPKVGETFSESLTSWTGKPDLAARFAANDFGSHGGAVTGLGGDVILMLKANQTKGLRVSDYAPKDGMVGQADEYITSGEYRIIGVHPVRTEVEGVYVTGFTNEKVVVVERIGPAKAHDIRKEEATKDEELSMPDQVTAPDATRFVKDFVSFADTGDQALQLIASLHTSRLAAWGFTTEAQVQGITEYELKAQIDNRTSHFCRQVANGRRFKVQEARDKLTEVLSATDPADLKVLQPWPAQDKDSIAEYQAMSNDELMKLGLLIPPFHPRCRTLLARVGSENPDEPPEGTSDTQELDDLSQSDLDADPVDQQEAADAQSDLAPDDGILTTLATATVAMFVALGVQATQDQVDAWNDYLGVSPALLFSMLDGVDPDAILQEVVNADIDFQGDPTSLFSFYAEGALAADGSQASAEQSFDPETSNLSLDGVDLGDADQQEATDFLQAAYAGLAVAGETIDAQTLSFPPDPDTTAALAVWGATPLDQDSWDAARDDIVSQLSPDGNLSEAADALNDGEMEVVMDLLSSDNPLAAVALAALPFTVDGEPLVDVLFVDEDLPMGLDLSDPDLIERYKTFLGVVS